MLSDHEIMKFRAMGAIIIEPFRPEALNPSSYDLTLGPYIARYKSRPTVKPLVSQDGALLIDLRESSGKDLFRIEDCSEKGVIIIRTGESILGHTNEFAGGTAIANTDGTPGHTAINTMIKATSTAGRMGLTACRCAGAGDPGFFSKWTLEITNHSPYDYVLPVGAIICQLLFFQVKTPTRMYQEASGNYQPHRDLEKLKEEWKPEHMLPKKLKVAP